MIRPEANRRKAPSSKHQLLLRCAAMLLAVGPGCGNNTAEIPPELLEAIENQGGAGDGDYPPGPYGTMVGDTVRDLCFEGWTDPVAQDFVPSALEPICLSDFHDPDGDEVELLLLNAGAVWCTACRSEYGGSAARPSLSDQLAKRRDRGFRILGTLFQDAENNPATVDDAALWAETFDVDFPFAIDPDFKVGAFTSPAQAPFNMLIDTRTMTIVQQLEGDQPAVLFTTVDTLLDERAAAE